MDNDSAPGLILVKTALDNLRDDVLLKTVVAGHATALDEVIFCQGSNDSAAAKNSSVIGGGGYMQETTDDVGLVNEANVAAAPLKTTIFVNFKKNLPISRTFMADQQQSAVSKAVRQQTQTWIASRDRAAFRVYANGFSGTGNSTTIDNVPLFSNSHINENGDTIDNLETGALTDPNLNIIVDSLRNQVNQAGVLIGYEPEFLLTPSILHQTGQAITKSVLRAGTGNNDENYWSDLYPGMKCVFNQFLNSTSTTAYFIGCADNGVERTVRERFFTNLRPWEENINDQYIYKMRAREAVDAIEYSGTCGSQGTTA